jgi:hypothetical protein
VDEMYEVRLELTVSGGPDRAAHFDAVVQAYAQLEAVDERLLDCSFGFSAAEDGATIDVEITVSASSEDEAHDVAIAGLRSAIQAAGGFTPGWAERSPATATAVYRVQSESVDRVPA